MKKTIFLCLCVLLSLTVLAQNDPNPEYVKVTNKRAQNIVDDIEIHNNSKQLQVRDIIAGQYQALNQIHELRDEKIEKLKKEYPEAYKEKVQKVIKEADKKVDRLHESYLKALSQELNGEQVEAVKDGMTYGVVPKTYSNYLDMLPQLTKEQKEFIHSHLIEAREYAMDAGSSDKKHWWFNQYKGKITNYLTVEGYDLKKAEKQWLANIKTYRDLADNVLSKMRLSEKEKTDRLIEATVLYLNKLKGILDQRTLALKEIEDKHVGGSQKSDSLIVEAYEIARNKYLPLKENYVNKLEDNLTPYQVGRVKDGLTYDLFLNFYAMYLEMVPNLKLVEKAHIRVLLVEGRENAMLAISKEGQTQWWDKYRGIINNYIASKGYDFGKLSKIWDKANQHKEWVN